MNNEPSKFHVNKFYKVLNVNNYALIVICVAYSKRTNMARANYCS